MQEPHENTQSTLAPLPVQLTNLGDVWTIRGIRPHYLIAVLQQQLGPLWATDVITHRTHCRCGTKTAVVPGAALHDWQDALAHSPFGASAVVPLWPYLGVTIVSLAPTEAPGTPMDAL